MGMRKSDVMEFELNNAQKVAEKLKSQISPYCIKIEIAGSIRRKKSRVHDIDIVCIPKMFQRIKIKGLLEHIGKLDRAGEKIIMGIFKNMPFDIYFATPDTYETLLLIRTGSKEHNVMLCMKARKRDMQLKANGMGLIKDGKVVTNTEEGILRELLGQYIEPEKRG